MKEVGKDVPEKLVFAYRWGVKLVPGGRGAGRQTPGVGVSVPAKLPMPRPPGGGVPGVLGATAAGVG